jgi:eukaryotic-like serine/threonine-protein kinase
MSIQSKKCSKCGAVLPSDAPDGHCVRCILQYGLGHLSQLSATVGSDRPSAVTEQAGNKIGRFQLLQQIGEGGCGIVFLAEQEEPVRRRVALKVIKLGMDTKSVIARFEAERQALAMMDHPNIATILDGGATESGRPYFVMELVQGPRITDYCDSRKLSTGQRLGLFLQVCQAVQHAHQKGIIHRDLKPSNILVAEENGAPVPKIIDFGIAKATTDQPLTDKTLFTAFDQFIGTPAYTSPEQAGLGGLDIDTRSDIYSLGILLYELLAGATPFDAGQFRRTAMDEMLRLIREKEPPQPSARLTTLTQAELRAVAQCRQIEPAKLPAMLRGDLDWIVMKCLEKDRTRRYETANGLALDLRRYLKQEPVLARPPSLLYQFQKLVRRNKLIFAAASAIAAALAVGVALSVWSLVKEHQARLEAEKVAQFLEDMLKGVGPSVALGRDTALLKEILDKTAKRVGTDLLKQPEVEAQLQYTLGEVYWELGDLENAEAMHRAALAVRIKALGRQNPVVAQSMRRLGHVLWRRGRLEEAEKMARAAVAMQRGLFSSRNLEVARSLDDLSAILNTKGTSDSVTEAAAALRESLSTKIAVLGRNNLEVAGTMEDLAGLLPRCGKAAEAAALAHEALAIRTKLQGADNPLVIIQSLKDQATDLESHGKLTEEETTLNDLMAAQRKLLGQEHPDLAQSLNRLAMVFRKEGKLPQSEATRREALAMQRKLLGGENAEVAQTLSNLGQVLADQNKLPDAEGVDRECLGLRRKLFGQGDINVAYSLDYLGGVLEREGQLEEARKLYLEAANGAPSAAAALAQFSLGQLYQNGKGVPTNLAEAVNWFRKSADAGNRGAQCILGQLYLQGAGVPQDDAEGAKWLLKAAGQGHALAQNTVGNLYATGRGVPRDLGQSIQWLTKAARQGIQPAQLNLAQLYDSGDSVTRDMAQAAWWYRKAARLQNGTNALRWAERAVVQSFRQDAALLDTLAAAYSLSQQFDKAVAVEQEALALLQSERDKQDFAARLKLYQLGAPYREGAAPPQPTMQLEPQIDADKRR